MCTGSCSFWCRTSKTHPHHLLCSQETQQSQLLRTLNCKCKSPPKLHFHAASFIFYVTLSFCPLRNSWALPCTNSRENQGNNKGKALLSLRRQSEKSHQCSSSQSLKNRILAWKNPVKHWECFYKLGAVPPLGCSG